MMLSTRPIQIWSQMRTKSHCTKTYKVAKYAQQHPTRLGKQLHPQTVGLLFSAMPKHNNNFTYRQLPRCAGKAV
ncbi:MAG TPA: hypothetical protein EYH52_03365 [Acinetobacter venetianus]|nr:hypothetical protein [Acinetobacter venetianus]